MKRRKFLQILGLTAAAPVAVVACPFAKKKKPYTKPKLKKYEIGIDWGNGDKSVCWEGNNNEWIEYEFPTGNEIAVKHIDLHDYSFPNKPIFPNYMITDA